MPRFGMFAECFIMSAADEATMLVQDTVESISIVSTLLQQAIGQHARARGHKMAIIITLTALSSYYGIT